MKIVPAQSGPSPGRQARFYQRGESDEGYRRTGRELPGGLSMLDGDAEVAYCTARERSGAARSSPTPYRHANDWDSALSIRESNSSLSRCLAPSRHRSEVRRSPRDTDGGAGQSAECAMNKCKNELVPCGELVARLTPEVASDFGPASRPGMVLCGSVAPVGASLSSKIPCIRKVGHVIHRSALSC